MDYGHLPRSSIQVAPVAPSNPKMRYVTSNFFGIYHATRYCQSKTGSINNCPVLDSWECCGAALALRGYSTRSKKGTLISNLIIV